MEWETKVVMTCYTGRMMCEIDDVYKFLNWMTNDNLFTHALPRAADKCNPYLEKQFPWMKDVNCEEITKDNWEDHLQRIIAEHGEKLEVEQLPVGEWEHRNPIEELLELMNKKQEDAK